ncbi:hypothetical protein IPL68_02925 [Candidatus Saccharibacteria bacterium]|nr:MAG: hypothetical protein IPL68_02925 [Candidatus Saccharibacteria bacterium]
MRVGDGNEVHHVGYNNSSLYEGVRARQIWEKMQDDPKRCRLDVLEMSDGQQPDSTWLIDGPAVVPEELMPVYADAAATAVQS